MEDPKTPTTPQTVSTNNANAETNVAAPSVAQIDGTPGTAKIAFDISKFISWQIVKDFFNFKIMVIPILIKWIYILTLVSLLPFTFGFSTHLPCGPWFGLVLWPFFYILAVVVSHMLFELLMLGFVMIDVMREVRDELIRQNRK